MGYQIIIYEIDIIGKEIIFQKVLDKTYTTIIDRKNNDMTDLLNNPPKKNVLQIGKAGKATKIYFRTKKNIL